jgi:hypothetical protein
VKDASRSFHPCHVNETLALDTLLLTHDFLIWTPLELL